MAIPSDEAWKLLRPKALPEDLSVDDVTTLARLRGLPLREGDAKLIAARLNAAQRVLSELDGWPWRDHDPISWQP